MTDLEPDELVRLLGAGLAGVDDGELFLEYRETESLAFDDGRLKSASFDASRALVCARSPGRRSAMPTARI